MAGTQALVGLAVLPVVEAEAVPEEALAAVVREI